MCKPGRAEGECDFCKSHSEGLAYTVWSAPILNKDTEAFGSTVRTTTWYGPWTDHQFVVCERCADAYARKMAKLFLVGSVLGAIVLLVLLFFIWIRDLLVEMWPLTVLAGLGLLVVMISPLLALGMFALQSKSPQTTKLMESRLKRRHGKEIRRNSPFPKVFLFTQDERKQLSQS